MNLRCAFSDSKILRALAANIAYSAALSVANKTNVVERIQSCGHAGSDVLINCGRKATKNIIPFGFKAVTSQVFPNSFHLESRSPAFSTVGGVAPDINNLMPR